MPHLAVTIDSRLECVALAGTLVRVFSQQIGATAQQASEFELCVVEAANNSIAHTYAREPGHTVQVLASWCSGELRFEVRDRGASLDDEDVGQDHADRLEVDTDNLESIPESGRGLAIIEAIMDRVKYVTEPGANCFIMVKHLPGP